MKNIYSILLIVACIITASLTFSNQPEKPLEAITTMYIDTCIVEAKKKKKVPKIDSTKVSYYGKNFHGKKTASGAIYNMWAMTCASPTLKFGTKVKITNLSNNKSIIVKVNDRGPYAVKRIGKGYKVIYPLKPHPERAFDLSKGAFMEIGNIKKGILSVKYEII